MIVHKKAAEYKLSIKIQNYPNRAFGTDIEKQRKRLKTIGFKPFLKWWESMDCKRQTIRTFTVSNRYDRIIIGGDEDEAYTR